MGAKLRAARWREARLPVAASWIRALSNLRVPHNGNDDNNKNDCNNKINSSSKIIIIVIIVIVLQIIIIIKACFLVSQLPEDAGFSPNPRWKWTNDLFSEPACEASYLLSYCVC